MNALQLPDAAAGDGQPAATDSPKERTDENQQDVAKAGQHEQQPVTETRSVTWKGVLLYGICTLMGSHFTNWSIGLNCGFWEYFGVMFIIMTAFGCVALCVAEMTAALPFSGGTYGVVRVTLGDLAGYLIGTTETFQYILYVAFNIVTMGSYVTKMTGYDAQYEPLYWVAIYGVIIAVLTFHKTLYWRSMTVLGAYICVILLLYCTMTREGANFERYTHDPVATHVSLNERVLRFFQYLPHGSWFFGLAAKIMPLACVETVNPTVNVPRAIYYSYALAIVSAFCIIFSAASISPGVAVLRTSSAPLTFGFSRLFRIPFEHAIAFTLVAKFATCLAFSFAYSTQIAALAKSGFLWRGTQHSRYLPECFSGFISILTGSLIGYAMMIVIWYWDKDYKVYLMNGYLLLGYSINIVIFATYISFRYKFRSLVKQYESPVGIAGAVYGSVVFGIVFVSVGALQQTDRYTYFVLLAVFMAVWTLPYYAYYRHHLSFSEEESTILFIAYVIKANVARRARKLRPLRQSFLQTDELALAPLGQSQKIKKSPTSRSPNLIEYSNNGHPQGDARGGQRGSVEDQPTAHLVTTTTATAASIEGELELAAAHSRPPIARSGSRSAPAEPHRHGLLPPLTSHATYTAPAPSPSTVRLPYMEQEYHLLGRQGAGDKVAPLVGKESGEKRSRRIASVESVLVNEFQYEQTVVGSIHKELQEFYDNSSDSVGSEEDAEAGM